MRAADQPLAGEPAEGEAPAGEAAELVSLADELLRAMGSIRRSGRRIAGRPVELSALTGAQLDLVRLVRRRPGVSVGEAAAELRLAPNTVSTLVRQLTAGGVLVRTSDAADRRVARLELTAGMQSKVGAFRDRRLAMLAAAMADLPPRDRRRVRGAVEVMGQLAAQLPDRVAADA